MLTCQLIKLSSSQEEVGEWIPLMGYTLLIEAITLGYGKPVFEALKSRGAGARDSYVESYKWCPAHFCVRMKSVRALKTLYTVWGEDALCFGVSLNQHSTRTQDAELEEMIRAGRDMDVIDIAKHYKSVECLEFLQDIRNLLPCQRAWCRVLAAGSAATMTGEDARAKALVEFFVRYPGLTKFIGGWITAYIGRNRQSLDV